MDSSVWGPPGALGLAGGPWGTLGEPRTDEFSSGFSSTQRSSSGFSCHSLAVIGSLEAVISMKCLLIGVLLGYKGQFAQNSSSRYGCPTCCHFTQDKLALYACMSGSPGWNLIGQKTGVHSQSHRRDHFCQSRRCGHHHPRHFHLHPLGCALQSAQGRQQQRNTRGLRSQCALVPSHVHGSC